MKLTEFFNNEQTTLSFEVFPPKTDATFASVVEATEQIAALKPDFMSVTYGAGGGSSKATIEVAANLIRRYGVPVTAHLTCVGASEDALDRQLDRMQAAGIDNIMALRGDIPKDMPADTPWRFRHASELIAHIKTRGDFCIGGACYPEVHPESRSQRDDLRHLKAKVDAGCDYLVTQMFFDNNIYYNFLYKARDAGIRVPILPGVMPITRAGQISRAVQLSGTNVPARFRQIVDAFGDRPEAMKQAGIACATEQIVDLLANGVRHIHVYSMNKPDVAAAILRNVGELLK